jgi:hypothetical protein
MRQENGGPATCAIGRSRGGQTTTTTPLSMPWITFYGESSLQPIQRYHPSRSIVLGLSSNYGLSDKGYDAKSLRDAITE